MIGSKVTSRGQTTIPKPIRDRLGLEPGDRVLFVEREGEVVLQPMKESLRDLRGSLEPRTQPEDYDRVRHEVRRAVGKRAVDD